MKLLPKVLCINIVLIGMVAGMSASATLLTFDSLPTGALPAPGYGVIPNGYGGLNWNNFGVLNGSVMDPSYGYHTGMVSPNNVAFNLYGDPASITTSRGLFNLNSAYLTLALNLPTPLEIQVQGYLGAALLYNQTYVVNSSGPTFVNFQLRRCQQGHIYIYPRATVCYG
jgi:hypothetical protein